MSTRTIKVGPGEVVWLGGWQEEHGTEFARYYLVRAPGLGFEVQHVRIWKRTDGAMLSAGGIKTFHDDANSARAVAESRVMEKWSR